MARTTTILIGTDGRPLVRHVAPQGPAADALRHEAEALERAEGLGVVGLIDVVETPDGGVTVQTRYVAGGTLTDLVRAHGELAATSALASIAGTLADLHERGIAHTRCTADHVVGGAGTAVLCGLSAARLAPPGRRAEAEDDMDGFARLVMSTLTSDDDLAQRARRAVARLGGSPSSTNLRAVAAELAALTGPVDRPRPAPPTTRPASADPALSRGGTIVHHLPLRGHGDGSRRRRAGRAAVLAVTVGLLGGVLALRTGPGDSPSELAQTAAPPGTQPVTTTMPVTTTIPDTTTMPVTTTIPVATTMPVTTTTARAESEGSSEAVRIWPDHRAPTGSPVPPTDEAAIAVTEGGGHVVDHAGVRFGVGSSGDLVIVGDWDCDGEPTPSVIRPEDGSVWTFRTWATGTDVLAADALGYAPRPVAAATVPGGDGCDVIAVTTADGREILIDPN